MLKLTKKGDKYWLFEDNEIGLFSPSKFTINLELNEIVIVYENGLKSKRYNVIDCEIYDLGELTPFTTSSGDLFMQKLEELNCPCFQKNENIYNIYGGGAWGDITGKLSDQTDLQNALDEKLSNDIADYTTATLPLSDTDKLLVNQGGTFKEVAKSEFGGSSTNKQIFHWWGGNWNTPTLGNYYYIGYNGGAIEGLSSSLVNSVNGRNKGLFIAPFNCKIKRVIFKEAGTGSYTGAFVLVSGLPNYNGTWNNAYTNVVTHLNEAITSVGSNQNKFEFLVIDNITIPKGYAVCPMLVFSAQAATNKLSIEISIEIEEVV